MDELKYNDSFSDLQVRIQDLLSQIDGNDEQGIQNSYLSFLDNFLVLVDQIINGFHEGRVDNEELKIQMNVKQNKIMSSLNNIVETQKDRNWQKVSAIIRENLESDLQEWKETVEKFFPG